MPFEDAAIADMVAVGATDARSARIWVRSSMPGRHELVVHREGDELNAWSGTFDVPSGPGDGTASVRWPDDFEGARPLAPAAPHRFRVIRSIDGAVLGDGRFVTAPIGEADTPSRFSIAVMSCHQPFDDEGRIRPTAQRALDALVPALEQSEVARVLMLGDQMYADWPPALSLFDAEYFRKLAPAGRESILDCTREEVRRLYHQRYRIFWQTEAFRRVQALWPSYLVHDDHEIVDNFGVLPEHSTPRWEALRDGALDAAFDYQGTRTLARGASRPHAQHFTLEYGPLAAFVMDLRSERRVDGGELDLYGDAQLDDLARFLRDQIDRPILVIGMSVPLVHIPDWLTAIGALAVEDAHDRWSHPRAHRSRAKIVRLLYEHQRRAPRQKLLFVGGDVHVGAVMRFDWRGTPAVAHQLTASAVTNEQHPIVQKLAKLAPKISVALSAGAGETLADVRMESGRGEPNPYDRLNIGLIRCERRGARWVVRLALVGLDPTAEGPPRPEVVFESDEI